LKQWIAEGRNHLDHEDYGSFTTVTAATTKDIEKALQTEPYPTIDELKRMIPPEVHDMLPLFNRREAEQLALYREGIDHKIDLREQPNGALLVLL
jgi:hypothetical protein